MARELDARATNPVLSKPYLFYLLSIDISFRASARRVTNFGSLLVRDAFATFRAARFGPLGTVESEAV